MITDLAYKHLFIKSTLEDIYYCGEFGISYEKNNITFKIRYNYTDELYDKIRFVVKQFNKLPQVFLDFKYTTYSDKLVIYGICMRAHYNQITKLIKS